MGSGVCGAWNEEREGTRAKQSQFGSAGGRGGHSPPYSSGRAWTLTLLCETKPICGIRQGRDAVATLGGPVLRKQSQFTGSRPEAGDGRQEGGGHRSRDVKQSQLAGSRIDANCQPKNELGENTYIMLVRKQSQFREHAGGRRRQRGAKHHGSGYAKQSQFPCRASCGDARYAKQSQIWGGWGM